MVAWLSLSRVFSSPPPHLSVSTLVVAVLRNNDTCLSSEVGRGLSIGEMGTLVKASLACQKSSVKVTMEESNKVRIWVSGGTALVGVSFHHWYTLCRAGIFESGYTQSFEVKHKPIQPLLHEHIPYRRARTQAIRVGILRVKCVFVTSPPHKQAMDAAVTNVNPLVLLLNAILSQAFKTHHKVANRAVIYTGECLSRLEVGDVSGKGVPEGLDLKSLVRGLGSGAASRASDVKDTAWTSLERCVFMVLNVLCPPDLVKRRTACCCVVLSPVVTLHALVLRLLRRAPTHIIPIVSPCWA